MKYEAKVTKCEYCGSGKVYAKGLCRNCYARKQRNGTPEPKPRGVHSDEKKISEVIAMRKSGMTFNEIAKKFGTSHQAVQMLFKRYYKKTNADRIRAMSDEELAEFITNDYFVPHCPYTECLDNNEESCYGCWLYWLKQECET